jgi:hypothetical protein
MGDVADIFSKEVQCASEVDELGGLGVIEWSEMRRSRPGGLV